MDKSKVLKQLKLVPDAAKQQAWDAKETPEGAQEKATKALEDAKQFVQENAFNLEPATTEKLGGVKVGAGLSVTEDGTISAKELSWENVTGKPEEFKPETHTHTMSELTDYVPPTVDAELNKDSENALQNKVIATELEQMKKDGQSIKANKNFTLKVTDERDHTVNKSTGVSFLNGIYWGVAVGESEINDDFLKKLTKKLQGAKATTFTVNAGEGQHIFYAVPSRYGACGFNVGGFDGGFTKVNTFNFTNASGYAENYDVYKSDNANLGNTTVKVS